MVTSTIDIHRESEVTFQAYIDRAFGVAVSNLGEQLPPAAPHLPSALALPAHVASVVVAAVTIRSCVMAPIEFVATARVKRSTVTAAIVGAA